MLAAIQQLGQATPATISATLLVHVPPADAADRARWVAAEQWQPQQKRRFGADDRYILGIPYADGRERIMDILKHGDHAEVCCPSPQPERVHEQFRRPHAPAPGAVALRNRPSAGEQPSTPVLP